MGEKCYIDMSLLEFTHLGMKRLGKDPTLPELLLTAHDVLQKIELMNRDGDKVKFTENGLELDEDFIKKLEVNGGRLYTYSEEEKRRQNATNTQTRDRVTTD